MKKYEQGGGVVPTPWIAGQIPADEQFGRVVAEIWTIRFDWRGVPEVMARTHYLQWNPVTEGWSLDGSQPMAGRVRRWMRLGRGRTAYPSLTLEDWPNV
jgi:hypothetical protein